MRYPTGMRILAVLPIVLLAPFAATSPLAGPMACGEGGVTVSGAEPGVADRVCAAVGRGRGLLARCGLAPPAALTIEVGNTLPGLPRCIGRYDCDANRITLVAPDALAARPEVRDTFGGLPSGRLFDSLVVHEVAHAAVARAVGDREIGVAGHEYIASAFQMASLAAAERDMVLARWPVTPPVRPEVFSTMILAFAPGAFTANAWVHFDTPGHGCAFVRRLVAGEIALGLPEP